ncbi:MAG: metallophosphoesterase [Leptolyngbya sp. SIO4C1]|nr:metallophosphoesterase [Leptolyngbya sp. SIO4C1]
MPLNRRRFIVLGGLALGACSSAAVPRRRIAQGGGAIWRREDERVKGAETWGRGDAETTERLAGQEIGPAGLYAPVRGDVRAVVISDMNSRYGATDYRAEVLTGIELLPGWQPDLVICAGDMIAAQKISLTSAEVAAMWESFDRQILTPIRAANLPFALTIGNHDASSLKRQGEYVFAVDRQAATQYWQAHLTALALPYVEATGFPYYYSFKQNDIFYLIWDASAADVPAEQLAWAERSLSSPEAQSAKLRIAIGHLPFFAISQGRDRAGEILNHSEALRSLLETYRVHTYISGHHHAYFPAHAGQLQLLHCGALGSGPRTWLNRVDTAMQTLTVLDIFLEDASTVYTTYSMNTLQVVDAQQLPRQIVGPTGRLLRRDVASADLSQAERNQQYVPSAN